MRAMAMGFAVALLLTLLLTPLVRQLALRLGALDPFSARKVRKPSTVPRLGGLGIAVAFYFTVGLLWLLGSTVARATISPETPVGLILLGGVPILLLGIIDDLHGLRALPKLLVQTVVGVALWWSGLRVLGASSLHGSVAAVWLCFLRRDGAVAGGGHQCRKPDRWPGRSGFGRGPVCAGNNDAGRAVAGRAACWRC
jgi:UDP-N-acetylmuramyl pentapeptide phosphotransferase/UDP-N-acetylglucosamine-1-phosphate transferase